LNLKSKEAYVPEIVFEPLPGEFTWITGGGTRTAIKLSRPWQEPLGKIINPKTCPFETKPQEEIPLRCIPTGWKLLPDPWTPHLQHRLIIPEKCWPPEVLQTLGGSVQIAEALEIARLATVSENAEIGTFAMVGWLGGQNIGHCHWHLHQPRVRKPLAADEVNASTERIVRESDKFLTIAGGARSGECLILPKSPLSISEENLLALAASIDWIVRRGNEKFLSSEWLPPEFALTVRFSPDRHIRYADYSPFLTPWGSPEHVTAPLEGGPVTLPWPHEVTAAYLR
jgi:hypothetical protein